MRSVSFCTIVLAALAVGCGTTRWSDTARTATEQLLLSTAVDRAIDNMDFKPMADKHVYLDPQYLDCVDSKYVISTLRQHMLSEGCVLMPDADSADYVIEVRSGTVGTDHHDVLVGVPAIRMPGGTAGMPAMIPEIPFAKSTSQRGIAKLACFAYDRETGQAVWQSGVFPIVSTAKDSWFMGTGPFQRGTIYDGTHFAGSRFMFSRKKKRQQPLRVPDVTVESTARFPERRVMARKKPSATSAKTSSKAAAAAGGNGNDKPVSGMSAPSLSGNSTSAPGGGTQSAASAGTSTGMPSGKVVQLPAFPESSSSGESSSGLSSLHPSNWLKLK